MKKCVIISDSFKGTLSTFDIMSLFNDACKKIYPNCEVLSFPIADGGEGTMEAFASALEGEKITIKSFDSNMNSIDASYFISNGVAYMDSATCIYLASTKIKDPNITSSYGIGLLIKDAINKGCKKIVLGLGGSSTNDGGCGLLSSLGVKFYNKDKETFVPKGGSLDKIVSFDKTELDNLIKGVEIIGMCDVTNPLLGENGASIIYSPQKGASKDEAITLDRKMKTFHTTCLSQGIKDYSCYPGAGAAGGLGYALISFLNGKLERGIKVLLNALDFETKLNDVDIIFTGEGKVDSQTLNGKVVDGINDVALKHNIPLVVIAGGADSTSEELISKGVSSIVTTTRIPMEFSHIKPYSRDFYYQTILNTLRLIKLGETIKQK